jgi:excisionase family DNA binding protein
MATKKRPLTVKKSPGKRTADTERLVLTPREARERLGLSEPTLRALLRSGRIAAIRLEHRIYIPKKSLDAFLETAGALMDDVRRPATEAATRTRAVLKGALKKSAPAKKARAKGRA